MAANRFPAIISFRVLVPGAFLCSGIAGLVGNSDLSASWKLSFHVCRLISREQVDSGQKILSPLKEQLRKKSKQIALLKKTVAQSQLVRPD